jgi:flavin-dependent dehydrogenase
VAVREYDGGTSSDAVVVGGRVAGALTAAYLADAGLDVVVLESAAITSGTISTHFFRGDGLVAALASIGVLEEVLATDPPPLTCDYWYPDAGPDPEVEPPQEPGEIGYCLSVRRETLDPLVAARVAGDARITWLAHRRVVGLVEGPDGVRGVVDADGHRHLAPLVVGADGRRSTVARLVSAPSHRVHAAARVLIYRYLRGYRGPDGAAGAEFSLRGNEMAYAFPSDSGTTCLAVTVPLAEEAAIRADAEAFFDDRLRHHRGIWPRYADAERLGKVVAGRSTPDYVRQAAGPEWALVGDAGVHQDPWSGMGMDAAARQARALADAVARGGDWQSTYAVARDAVALERWEETIAAADDLSVVD